MTQRTPIVGGNWKMHTDRAGATDLARGVAAGVSAAAGCDVFVCPPFPWLVDAGAALAGSPVGLAAQDVCQHPPGAYTGAVSTEMLGSAGVGRVLIGHSERRHVFGEDDAVVAEKLVRTLDAGLDAVLCVGELESEREAGETVAVVTRQLDTALAAAGMPAPTGDLADRLVIAYEPVWAIGTGRTAGPEDAQAVHAAIRDRLASGYDPSLAARLRIQYGGSVKPGNAADLMAQPDVDGFLVGGASLVADDFLAIIAAAADRTA